jgi:hypothetical protein
MKYKLLTTALLLSSVAAYAAPPAFNANYTVSKSGVTLGNMSASLSYNGSSYSYQKLSKANGLAAMLSGDTLTERSSGTKQGETLISKHYFQQHKNKRKNRTEDFSFNGGRVSGSFDGRAYQLSVPANTLDPALMELRLMDDLAAGKPLSYKVVDKGELRAYQFRKLGKETVSTAAGSYACEKVQVSRNNGERQTTLWLAPELNYAIVKVVHNEEGSLIQMQLNSYTPR